MKGHHDPVLCPQCGAPRAGVYAPCTYCGMKFVRQKGLAPPQPVREPRTVTRGKAGGAVEFERLANGVISGRELRIIGVAIGIAIAAMILPVVKLVAGLVSMAAHETGRTAVSWALGHVALPVMHLEYGTSTTELGGFSPMLAAIAGAGLLWLAWHYRNNRLSLIVIGAIAGLWLLCVTAEWRRETAVAAAGFAAELIVGGIFLYHGLSERDRFAWIQNLIEASAGAFLLLNPLVFGLRLASSKSFAAWYRSVCGGIGDLEMIALNLHLHVLRAATVQMVAAMLFLSSIVAIVLALAWHRHRIRFTRTAELLAQPSS